MPEKRLKVMTILGTRPEIIRLSRVMARLDQYTDHILVHTGQNYDYELNEIFFTELQVRKPDYFLSVDTSSLGRAIGDIIAKSEPVMVEEKPDALLILGDTNSSLAAIIGKRLKIPIYHMEAGNRCFDFNVPEEINRRIIDHISDFNLVYTEHARRNLLAEGLPARKIYLTGSPLNEVLHHYLDRIKSADALSALTLKPGQYFLLSVHREENVDNPKNLQAILDTITRIVQAFDLPVIVSTHPRTRQRLEKYPKIQGQSRIVFHKPFGFFDYCHLELNACCVISDSGSISEEASILGFPAITIRNAIERPEAMDSGNIVLTGLDTQTVIDAISLVTQEKETQGPIPVEYTIPNTSRRVVKLILGTARLALPWSGIVS